MVLKDGAQEIIDEGERKKEEFTTKYPDYVIAEAYQSEYPIFLSEMPTKSLKYMGAGFNHGSNNLIENCPARILICAEDD